MMTLSTHDITVTSALRVSDSELKVWSAVKFRETRVPQNAIVPLGRPRPYSIIILNMLFIPKASIRASSQITASSYIWGPLYSPTAHWSDGPLGRRLIGPTAHWSDDPLVRRSIDPTVHWSDGPLIRRPIGPTVHWSEGPLVRQPVSPTTSLSDGHELMLPTIGLYGEETSCMSFCMISM